MDKKGAWNFDEAAFDADKFASELLIDTKVANNVAGQLRMDVGVEALKKQHKPLLVPTNIQPLSAARAAQIDPNSKLLNGGLRSPMARVPQMAPLG